jgi:hypothetical protein
MRRFEKQHVVAAQLEEGRQPRSPSVQCPHPLSVQDGFVGFNGRLVLVHDRQIVTPIIVTRVVE